MNSILQNSVKEAAVYFYQSVKESGPPRVPLESFNDPATTAEMSAFSNGTIWKSPLSIGLLTAAGVIIIGVFFGISIACYVKSRTKQPEFVMSEGEAVDPLLSSKDYDEDESCSVTFSAITTPCGVSVNNSANNSESEKEDSHMD